MIHRKWLGVNTQVLSSCKFQAIQLHSGRATTVNLEGAGFVKGPALAKDCSGEEVTKV